MSSRAVTTLLLAILAATPLAAQDGDAAWTTASAERTLAGAPGILETVWTTARPPGGPHDRIELHRYRGGGTPRAALLYLPGTHMNGEAEVRDERYNARLYLARRGVDVYALDYRTHTVPAADVEDFAFMGGWGVRLFVEDARAASSSRATTAITRRSRAWKGASSPTTRTPLSRTSTTAGASCRCRSSTSAARDWEPTGC